VRNTRGENTPEINNYFAYSTKELNPVLFSIVAKY